MPRLFFVKRAPDLISKHRLLRDSGEGYSRSSYRIQVNRYKGSNPHVLRMKEYLHRTLRDDIYLACVHGSMGSQEEIPYSDFDAVAVLRDDVFESPRRLARAAYKLYGALRILYDADPLQHHGWFALARKEERDYPRSFFPEALWDHAGALWPAEGAEWTVNLQEMSPESLLAWRSLAQPFIDRLRRRQYPGRMYGLKALCSQFMLLPSLYLQARDGTFCYKKFSFEKARQDFVPELWSAMDEVSLIRREWSQRLTAWQRFLFRRHASLSRPLALRLSPKIPPRLKAKLESGLFERMAGLAEAMHRRLEERRR